MEPLPLIFRRVVAFVFFVLFAVILLVVSIYASGYRLGEEFTLERTGGVHISVPTSGATVYLDGKEIGTSSFLDKSFFIDNLPAGTYTVTVEKEEYRTWEKRLIVERAFVTDASAFILPQEFEILKLIPLEEDETVLENATSTRSVSEETLEELTLLFDDAPTQTATSTETTVDPITFMVRDGNVYVRWNRNLDRAPSAFCIAPQACVVEISVELEEATVTDAAFFENGIVYQTEEGIYLSEIDVKQPRVLAPLYEGDAVSFRIVENELFILDGEDIFVLEL